MAAEREDVDRASGRVDDRARFDAAFAEAVARPDLVIAAARAAAARD